MKVKDEQALRQELVDYGKKLLESGLVQGTWGNLSVRLNDSEMLATPSGLDYERLTAEDMVKVNIETLEYEGKIKPTSERGLHGIIYRNRPDAGAVIHTHSKYCSIFAAARMPLPVEPEEKREKLGDFLKIAEYGIAGSKKLAENAWKAMGNRPGCIMTSHGMICCGEDLENAFGICREIEEAAKEYIERRWEK